MQFNRGKGTFQFEFEPDELISAPTEIYVPSLQYPHGFEVNCKGAEWSNSEDQPLIFIQNPTMAKVTFIITRKK
jgi:hypothetical protein